jgi:hypothetical protein
MGVCRLAGNTVPAPGSLVEGAAVHPGFQIVECVDHATAQLAISRARAVGSVLFQGPRGQAEKACRFRRAQISRRQLRVRVGHLRGSVVVRGASQFSRASTDTMAEQTWLGGYRRCGDDFRHPCPIMGGAMCAPRIRAKPACARRIVRLRSSWVFQDARECVFGRRAPPR